MHCGEAKATPDCVFDPGMSMKPGAIIRSKRFELRGFERE
jgi:hypothetical protein